MNNPQGDFSQILPKPEASNCFNVGAFEFCCHLLSPILLSTARGVIMGRHDANLDQSQNVHLYNHRGNYDKVLVLFFLFARRNGDNTKPK